MLDVIQQRDEFSILGLRTHEPQMGVELIDGAICFDPQMVFGHPPAADQSGLAAVTRPSIDTRPGGSAGRGGPRPHALWGHSVPPPATAGSRAGAAAGRRR